MSVLFFQEIWSFLAGGVLDFALFMPFGFSMTL
jgi:hypothetical protein